MTNDEGWIVSSYKSVTDRRRGLVDAAVRVISAEGVARATTRRIADEAGVSGAIVHYAFETKDDLFKAVYESLTAIAFTEIGAHISPGIGLEAGARQVLAGFARWITADRNAVLALLELTAWSLRNPDSRHLATRVYRRHIDLTASLLAEAAPEADALTHMTTARLINVALDGIYLQWRALGDDSFDELLPVAEAMIVAVLPSPGHTLDPASFRNVRS
jgi:AcrR family transcriptional regulator